MSTNGQVRDPAVLVDNLVVRFAEVQAVRGVSFAVEAGESFGLLGPNGAGKTTTIRVLTTLLKPTDGRAFVHGHDVVREGLAIRRILGYIPQAISIDGALTARENLEFYARVTDVPRKERRDRIDHAVTSWASRRSSTASAATFRAACSAASRSQQLF